jgi:hypothetical protein
MAYSDIKDPSAYFQTATYTGNSTSPRSVTLSGNSDMQPDWTWIKTRTGPYYHYAFDSSRYSGSSYYRLVPSETFAESVDSVSQLTAFNTDGFTLAGSSDMANVNWSTQNYVAWNWKANGGTTTSFSESGNNPGGTRQTSSESGFSIISYTGTGSAGTIAHGLPSTPELIIFKRRNSTSDWDVYHKSIGNGKRIELANEAQASTDTTFMNNTLPTSTNITVGTSANTNADGATYICYAFSPVQGYSKMGTYYGNSSTDGVFNYCGFKPAWVLIKCYTGANDSWVILDTARNSYNGMNARLFPDLNNAESTSQDMIDCLSNGFKLRTADTAYNGGRNYLWVAFAENPFVAGGIPTTAR